jgi:methyl-accepting chemotaxis protein
VALAPVLARLQRLGLRAKLGVCFALIFSCALALLAAVAVRESDARIVALTAGSLLLLGTALHVKLTDLILRPLRETLASLAALSGAEADLWRRIPIPADDAESSQLATSFNALLEKLCALVASIRRASEGVDESARQVFAAATQLAESAQQTLAQAQQVLQQSDRTALSAREAVQVASSALADSRATHQRVSELAESAFEIGEVVQLIERIAQQTHMLALNATIEASHAGAAGLGFAVVAGEVKDLARSTAGGTAQIRTRVAAVQEGSYVAAKNIGDVQAVICRIAELQSAVVRALGAQSDLAGKAGAAGKSQPIVAGAQRVTQLAETTHAQAAEAAQAASSLRSQAETLRELIARFQS